MRVALERAVGVHRIAVRTADLYKDSLRVVRHHQRPQLVRKGQVYWRDQAVRSEAHCAMHWRLLLLLEPARYKARGGRNGRKKPNSALSRRSSRLAATVRTAAAGEEAQSARNAHQHGEDRVCWNRDLHHNDFQPESPDAGWGRRRKSHSLGWREKKKL